MRLIKRGHVEAYDQEDMIGDDGKKECGQRDKRASAAKVKSACIAGA